MYTRFRVWRLDGNRERVHARLREDVRLDAGAPPAPETLRADSLTVTSAAGGPNGYDEGETGVSGRERFAAVDSLGLVWGVLAAAGLLAPVAGAVTQEVIDVHGVLNALRAAFPPRSLTDY